MQLLSQDRDDTLSLEGEIWGSDYQISPRYLPGLPAAPGIPGDTPGVPSDTPRLPWWCPIPFLAT